MSKVKEKKDVDYAEQAVPEEGRKGFVTMFMIMLGFTFFSASMWVGQAAGGRREFLGVPGLLDSGRLHSGIVYRASGLCGRQDRSQHGFAGEKGLR